MRALVLTIPAAMPFAWILVMANHCYDHPAFTFRILTCAVLAIYALPVYGVREIEKNGSVHPGVQSRV